ncbi:MAG: ribosome-associated translation inhibitor RaiA [Candidatus Aureabacteria bacterium]|nr:ribosome-associated translation inhibitor RaiA [Candidatus Auribacterota bacterium]
MDITVTGRHVSVTEPMKEYAKEKFSKMDKFTLRINDSHVIMDIEKYRQKAEVTLNGPHFSFHMEEVSDDMYKSIDNLIDRIEEKLRRMKGKFHNRKAKSVKELEMENGED